MSDPVDRDARRRIASDLDTTLFVEAGAGSGKTTTLVERVVALVLAGRPVTGIAAITFTEKAAAELRLRTRSRLTAVARDLGNPPASRAATVALEHLDSAPIGTVHAFARRLLARFPIETGLPPAIEVLDEIASQLAFDQRWRDDLETILSEAEHDDHLADALLYADVAGVRARHLRDLAIALGRDLDRLATWLPASAPPLPDLHVDDIADRLDALTELRTDTEARFPENGLVEFLARHSQLSEADIAQRAIQLAADSARQKGRRETTP